MYLIEMDSLMTLSKKSGYRFDMIGDSCKVLNVGYWYFTRHTVYVFFRLISNTKYI